MYKVGFQIIDYYDDKEMLMEMITGETPDFAKSAKLLNYDDRENTPDDYYAVVMMTKAGHKIRRYPVFDKSHTWLSCRAFEKTAHKLPFDAVKTAASILYSNCVYHDIECPASIKKFADTIYSNIVNIDEDKDPPLEYHIKQALINKSSKKISDNEYGIVTKTAKLYPLNTKGNTEKAISYFEEYSNQMLPRYRREFAQQITKYANYHGIHPDLDKHSSTEQGNRVKHNISVRRAFVKKAEEVQFLDDLTAKCKDIETDRLINIIEQFDKLAGLDRYWDVQIKNPNETVLEKLAIDSSSMGIRDDDIEAYAKTHASVELMGHLPEESINEFIMEPKKKYKDMSDIQKMIIIRGVTGRL